MNRPTEKQILEVAAEDLQDAVFNDGCLESWARGHMTIEALKERLEYLASKHTLEHAEERIMRDREDSFGEAV